MMKKLTTVRPSPIAGSWYSANPDQLRRTINTHLEKADPPTLPGEVVGIVAPHAGYRYSGPIAGYAFKTVLGQHFDTVVVISPSHQYYSGAILTTGHTAYRTPLGDIALADKTIERISQSLEKEIGQPLTPITNDQEHALEIELPFLQCALEGTFKLVPIMLRDQSRQIARALGQALAAAFKDTSCLLVASSDLSHFYPQAQANQLDQNVLKTLTAFSPEALFDLKARGEGQACGLAPMAAVLWAAEGLGANQVTLLEYDTSAAATGDTSSVVGYGAAAITRPT